MFKQSADLRQNLIQSVIGIKQVQGRAVGLGKDDHVLRWDDFIAPAHDDLMEAHDELLFIAPDEVTDDLENMLSPGHKPRLADD